MWPDGIIPVRLFVYCTYMLGSYREAIDECLQFRCGAGVRIEFEYRV